MNQIQRIAGLFLLTTSLSVAIMLLAGCSRVGGLASAEHVVGDRIRAQAPGVQSLQVSGPIQAPDGKMLALYAYTAPPSGSKDAKYCQGYVGVRPNALGGWEIDSTYTTSCSNAPPLALDIMGSVTETYVMVSGAVVNERVSAAEAVLDSGETVQVAVEDGFFMLFARREAGVCRLRLRDAEGEVLYSTSYELNVSRERGCPEEE